MTSASTAGRHSPGYLFFWPRAPWCSRRSPVRSLCVAVFLTIGRVRQEDGGAYEFFRRRLGRAILLGLEFLVAADIIRTVAVTPSGESVAVLGGIVLIRTFLSFSLQLEVTGARPWQQRSAAAADKTQGRSAD